MNIGEVDTEENEETGSYRENASNLYLKGILNELLVFYGYQNNNKKSALSTNV